MHYKSAANNLKHGLYFCCFNDISVNAISQFARIHTSSLIKIEKILNRPITKFYNSDDVNVIAAELGLAKTRPTSFYKKQSFIRARILESLAGCLTKLHASDFY